MKCRSAAAVVLVSAYCWLPFIKAATPQSGTACVVSDDPTYGYSRENPVPIGGGASVVAARERRYMDALRGPDGEELSYERAGSGPGPDGTILDIYSVSYEGAVEPTTLYLDAYRWAEPQVPRGLTCARPFNLPVPAPDPFGMAEDPPASPRAASPASAPAVPPASAPAARRPSRGGGVPSSLLDIDRAMSDLAIVYARERRTLDPIPLDPDRPEIGVALSPFHRKLLRTADQVARGLEPELPPEFGPGVPPTPGNTIVAFPIACGARSVAPAEITYIGMTRPGETGPVQPVWSGNTEAQLEDFLPGFDAPDGALATAFFSRSFNRDDEVVVRYEGGLCDDAGAELRMPIEVRLPRALEEVHAPDAVDVTMVQLRAVIDIDGVPHGGMVVEGTPPLHDEAVRLASQWRWRPYSVNGTPVPLTIGMRVRFGQ